MILIRGRRMACVLPRVIATLGRRDGRGGRAGHTC